MPFVRVGIKKKANVCNGSEADIRYGSEADIRKARSAPAAKVQPAPTGASPAIWCGHSLIILHRGTYCSAARWPRMETREIIAYVIIAIMLLGAIGAFLYATRKRRAQTKAYKRFEAKRRAEAKS